MKTIVFGTFALLCCVVMADPPLYGSDTNIIQLTSSNFDQQVLKSDDLWLIEFYAPWCGHCKAFAENYKKLSKLLKGVAKVGAVDTTAERDIAGRYKFQGVPTFMFFGDNKQAPQKYEGARSIDGMIDYVFDQARAIVNKRKGAPSGSGKKEEKKSKQESNKQEKSNDDSNVFVLTDANFDDTLKNSKELWMIEFYAPWCGHCKNLQPNWNAAATKLKGKVRFGKVDATAQTSLGQRYQIRGYPTIKVLLPGASLDSMIDYEGGRTADSIEATALKYLEQHPPKKEVFQLVNQKIFDDECASKNGVCVILFLPHLYDTKVEGRLKMIKVLEEAAMKNSIYPYYYFWSQAYDQKQLEKTLNLGAGYPAVVSISPSKKKFSVMRGAFTVDDVSAYLKDLIRGFERISEYKDLPKLRDVDTWDGQDYHERTDL